MKSFVIRFFKDFENSIATARFQSSIQLDLRRLCALGRMVESDGVIGV